MSDLAPTQSYTLNTKLRVGKHELALNIEVADAPGDSRELIPIARKLAELSQDLGIKDAEQAGRQVSCRAGCGACCRQLVAISLAEARHLLQYITTLPEARQTAIAARFSAIRAGTDAAGMTHEIINPNLTSMAQVNALGLRYFALGMPCPFLEDESCSIYEERPLICREFLVSSDPQHCNAPGPETIVRIGVPLRTARALSQVDTKPNQSPLVALSLLPTVMAAFPAPAEAEPVPELMHRFFEKLTQQTLPTSADNAATMT